MRGLTLDSGALIGVERASARMATLLTSARRRGLDVRVPAPVLAQVFRGGARQARLAQLLHFNECHVVAFDEEAARASGSLLGASETADVVDASVVVCSWRYDDIVVTSDPDDLRRLDPSLRLVTL